MKKNELKKILSDPLYFLTTYCVDEDDPKKPFIPFDWQAKVLSKIFSRDKNDKLNYIINCIATPRRQGKTTIGLRYCQYALTTGINKTILLVSAVSEENAINTLFTRLVKMLKHQKVLNKGFKYQRHTILSPSLNNKLIVTSSDNLSVLGHDASSVIFDEAWNLHPTKWNLWDDLTPTISARDDGQIIASSTVGAGDYADDPNCPMMRLYNHHIKQSMPKLYFYYSQNPFLSPKITPEVLEMERKSQSQAGFKRNWENIIGAKGESALTDEEMKRLVAPIPKTYRSVEPAFFGIDIGLKHDKTALAIVTPDIHAEIYILRYLQYWTPPKSGMNFKELEQTVENLIKEYPNFHILFDVFQAFDLVSRLQAKYGDKRVQTIQFSQNYKRSLFQNFVTKSQEGKFKVYPESEGKEISLFMSQLRGIVIGTDWNAKHGSQGDDLVIATAMALLKCAEVYPSHKSGISLSSDREYVMSQKSKKESVWSNKMHSSPIFEREERLSVHNQW